VEIGNNIRQFLASSQDVLKSGNNVRLTQWLKQEAQMLAWVLWALQQQQKTKVKSAPYILWIQNHLNFYITVLMC